MDKKEFLNQCLEYSKMFHQNDFEYLPLKLEVTPIQYDISAKCNEITLYTKNDVKIFSVHDYDNFVDIDLLKEVISEINKNTIS